MDYIPDYIPDWLGGLRIFTWGLKSPVRYMRIPVQLESGMRVINFDLFKTSIFVLFALLLSGHLLKYLRHFASPEDVVSQKLLHFFALLIQLNYCRK